MAGRLQGKTAFLTAAGAGIGRETAELFTAEGAKVIATDLDKSKLAGLKADCRGLDVRSTDAVNAIAKDIGAIDILFNCADILRDRVDRVGRAHVECEIGRSHV